MINRPIIASAKINFTTGKITPTTKQENDLFEKATNEADREIRKRYDSGSIYLFIWDRHGKNQLNLILNEPEDTDGLIHIPFQPQHIPILKMLPKILKNPQTLKTYLTIQEL